MSRAYDAKQAAINAYPNDTENGRILFLEYLNCNEEDFEYEQGQSAKEYIYGEDKCDLNSCANCQHWKNNKCDKNLWSGGQAGNTCSLHSERVK